MKKANEYFDQLKKEIETINEKIETRGNEIDLLQIEIYKSKKWWSNTSNIISLFAVVISIIATIFTIKIEGQKEDSAKKLRVKEIVHRLTEIQMQLSTAAANYGVIWQATSPEINNLINELIEFSNKDQALLIGSDYNTLIFFALQLNRNEVLKDLFDKASRVVADNQTKFAIKNYEATYYFNIEKNAQDGRIVMRELVQQVKEDKLDDRIRNASLAQVYSNWSNCEFSVNEYKKCDSLLKLAENIVIKGKDSWKYENYPIVKIIKDQREYFDNKINTLPNTQYSQ